MTETPPQLSSIITKQLVSPSETDRHLSAPSLDPSTTYRDRRSFLYKKCAELPKIKPSNTTPIYFYSKSNNVAFCKAPKTGSTFIGIVVRALEYKKDLDRDIFYVNREIVHGRNEVTLNTVIKRDIRMVLVTRDPFTRLFSAYLDKYYILGIWGREMAKNIGKDHRKMRAGFCGFNISFEEFYERREDRHTLPVSSLCDPCSLRYDVICKQETLTSDTEHVLEVMNITDQKRQSIVERIHSKTVKDTIFSWIASHMWYFNIFREDCSNKILFMDTLWHVLQLQGYINSSLTFPSDLFEKLSVFTADRVTEFILKQMLSSPLTDSQMFLQKKRAVQEAYNRVRPATIARVQDKFARDFQLFGYDRSPPHTI
ncbi:carbohydrate sulfotransferase 13-like [Pecten maximus]|uniref:carbohydrate sulfotransferase 13-like n=1 Tax=Pecten maximus TaxID=6579 RepID=UPI0014586E87|nr:carbohydrate sulfotransferase 13-like [Pecten maximus]